MAAYTADRDWPTGQPPSQINFFAHGNRIVVAGWADVAGLTAPAYAYRRMYKLIAGDGDREIPGLFVYESGDFIPAEDWYASGIRDKAASDRLARRSRQ